VAESASRAGFRAFRNPFRIELHQLYLDRQIHLETKDPLDVNSWDLFDTLVGARDITRRCGDQPEGSHFPIAQNIRLVLADDIVISDYYDDAKARRILTHVAKLDNTLYVGDQIKATGRIWADVRIQHHTGDRLYEIQSAWRAGVKATLVNLARLTPFERTLYEAGFRGLALTIREARLVTYNAKYRALELFQIQANFPFLFLASLLLHRRISSLHLDRLLMCSRDACLWHSLQREVCNLHDDPNYEVLYFYSSRITRYLPSQSVLEYTRGMVNESTMIVDLCGSGRSLRRFIGNLPIRPALRLVVGYVRSDRGLFCRVPYEIEWQGTTAVELANLAKHPMVGDIERRSDGTFSPVFLNPTGIDWAGVPEICAMHSAFEIALSIMRNYDFTSDQEVDDRTTVQILRGCFQRIEHGEQLLREFAYPFFGIEEGSTREMIRNEFTPAHNNWPG
jgi:hypothetical protein